MLVERTATGAGDGGEDEAGMSRKRNIRFGFLPAHPTRAELAKSRRAFKAAVRQKTKALTAEYKRLRKSAHSGRTPQTRRLEQLFHEVYGPGGMVQNPRELSGMSAEQLAAIERLIKGKELMAQKKKSKKKNSRKGKMPAGLKAYWAKKRARKAKKKNPRRPRVKVRTRTVVKYRTRTVKVYPKRKRRKSNPRPASSRLNLGSGFTKAEVKKIARLVSRVSGKRTRLHLS